MRANLSSEQFDEPLDRKPVNLVADGQPEAKPAAVEHTEPAEQAATDQFDGAHAANQPAKMQIAIESDHGDPKGDVGNPRRTERDADEQRQQDKPVNPADGPHGSAESADDHDSVKRTSPEDRVETQPSDSRPAVQKIGATAVEKTDVDNPGPVDGSGHEADSADSEVVEYEQLRLPQAAEDAVNVLNMEARQSTSLQLREKQRITGQTPASAAGVGMVVALAAYKQSLAEGGSDDPEPRVLDVKVLGPEATPANLPMPDDPNAADKIRKNPEIFDEMVEYATLHPMGARHELHEAQQITREFLDVAKQYTGPTDTEQDREDILNRLSQTLGEKTPEETGKKAGSFGHRRANSVNNLPPVNLDHQLRKLLNHPSERSSMGGDTGSAITRNTIFRVVIGGLDDSYRESHPGSLMSPQTLHRTAALAGAARALYSADGKKIESKVKGSEPGDAAVAQLEDLPDYILADMAERLHDMVRSNWVASMKPIPETLGLDRPLPPIPDELKELQMLSLNLHVWVLENNNVDPEVTTRVLLDYLKQTNQNRMLEAENLDRREGDHAAMISGRLVDVSGHELWRRALEIADTQIYSRKLFVDPAEIEGQVAELKSMVMRILDERDPNREDTSRLRWETAERRLTKMDIQKVQADRDRLDGILFQRYGQHGLPENPRDMLFQMRERLELRLARFEVEETQRLDAAKAIIAAEARRDMLLERPPEGVIKLTVGPGESAELYAGLIAALGGAKVVVVEGELMSDQARRFIGEVSKKVHGERDATEFPSQEAVPNRTDPVWANIFVGEIQEWDTAQELMRLTTPNGIRFLDLNKPNNRDRYEEIRRLVDDETMPLYHNQFTFIEIKSRDLIMQPYSIADNGSWSVAMLRNNPDGSPSHLCLWLSNFLNTGRQNRAASQVTGAPVMDRQDYAGSDEQS